MEITIGEQVLHGPVLIPSISKFETQGSPIDAIRLQHALSEPISLVSAHDTVNDPELVENVVLFRDAKRLIFLDSGGYEASRIDRYVAGYRAAWTFERFRDAALACPHDLVASYDFFWDGNSADYGIDLVDFLSDHDFVDPGKLVPVIHLATFGGEKRLAPEKVVDVVDRIAAELNPVLVAIPERELGSGLIEKLSLTARIVGELRNKGRKTHLHILGCGNPLTFALLSAVGIGMADGLEWCRTLVGPRFHLHHFQQADQFEEPENGVYNPMAELIRDEADSYLVRALSRNLHALQGYQRLVGQAIQDGEIRKFIEDRFGAAAASVL